MARKRGTKELLTGKPQAQGWRDQFGTGETNDLEVTTAQKTSAPKYKRKTYLMTDELIGRIETQAEKAGVGINEMNRYLLAVALDLIEKGEHDVQVRTVQRRTLGV